MKQDITCVFEGVGGVGGIYISNLKASQNTALLKNLNINAIITVIRNIKLESDKLIGLDYLHIPADDRQYYELSKYFQQAFQFLEKVRRKTNVLVHCYAGVSRSVTIVTAYLMKKYSYSFTKVIAMIRRKRNKINPNKGFIQQLKRYEVRIGIAQKQSQTAQQAIRRTFSCQIRKQKSIRYQYLRKKQKERILKQQTEQSTKLPDFGSSLQINRSQNLKEECGSFNQKDYQKKLKNKTQADMQQNQDVLKGHLSQKSKNYLQLISNIALSQQQDCKVKQIRNQKTIIETSKQEKIQKIKLKVLQHFQNLKLRGSSPLKYENKRKAIKNLNNQGSSIALMTRLTQECKLMDSIQNQLNNQNSSHVSKIFLSKNFNK